jgi:TRAP-type mannitol/chloroaromatic compound transport system permease small subunit
MAGAAAPASTAGAAIGARHTASARKAAAKRAVGMGNPRIIPATTTTTCRIFPEGTRLRPLLLLSRGIDVLNERLGYLANFFVLLACLISAGNAMSRYAFDLSSNAWLEIQWYLFAGMVMLGASYTLKVNEHVRVDILYVHLSERGKEWLDLVGTIVFLVPSMLVIVYFSWSFFMQSWNIQEISGNAGGLLRWPVKFLVPLGFTLVALQGVSEIIKRIAALRGDVRFETRYERPLQ